MTDPANLQALMEADAKARFRRHLVRIDVDVGDCESAAIDAISEMLAENARLDEWRKAVIDELIVAHIYQKAHDTDPGKALHDAIAWNVMVALDPLVSADARALHDRIEASDA